MKRSNAARPTFWLAVMFTIVFLVRAQSTDKRSSMPNTKSAPPGVTPTPTCTPGGTPGLWTDGAPVAIDHYGGFMDSDGTYAYEGGGYAFWGAGNIHGVGRFN